jgi:NRPS condensation-like uncharacterized protein
MDMSDTHPLRPEQCISSLIEILPLTGAQKNVWFHQHLDSQCTAYNIGEIIRIKGSLDSDRLSRAQNYLVQNCNALRAKFLIKNGVPSQELLPFVPTPLQIWDLRSKQGIEQSAKAILNQEESRPFDLVNGPGYRFGLIQLTDREFIWFFFAHHLVIDAHGGAIFAMLLADIYRAANVELSTPLPIWEQSIKEDSQYSNSAKFLNDQQYWDEKLLGLDASFSLSSAEKDNGLIKPESVSIHLLRPEYLQISNLGIELGRSS